jgi:hypothetical protein
VLIKFFCLIEENMELSHIYLAVRGPSY